MLISLIVAMDLDRGIGRAGRLPWRLSSDLQNFKRLTMGHTLIVGRVTWESIGRPLPGRRMIVLTRRAAYPVPEEVTVCASLEDALAEAQAAGEMEVFIAGGAGVYRQALPLADRIYLTRVDAQGEADRHFPELDPHDWISYPMGEFPAGERDEYPFRTELLVRSRSGTSATSPTSFTDIITFFYTRDLQTTANFYETVLGLKLAVDQGGCRIYHVASSGWVGFCEREEAPDQPRGVVLTFVVEDVDAWAERLRSAGVTLEKEPSVSLEYGIYNLFFRDPNGYLLEIQRFLDPGWRDSYTFPEEE